MKLYILFIYCFLGLAFTAAPAVHASSVPYSIDHIEDYLNDATYFNGWSAVDNVEFTGTWQYTVIATDSGNRAWISDDGNTVFVSDVTSNFGTFRNFNFDTTVIDFQDWDGPYDVVLDSYTNNNYFELYRLTSASNTLSYLSTPVTLSAGTIIVGFNDNGFPTNEDRDFDDLIVAFTPVGSSLSPVNPIPEPGTMLLLGLGLEGMAGVGRKRFERTP